MKLFLSAFLSPVFCRPSYICLRKVRHPPFSGFFRCVFHGSVGRYHGCCCCRQLARTVPLLFSFLWRCYVFFKVAVVGWDAQSQLPPLKPMNGFKKLFLFSVKTENDHRRRNCHNERQDPEDYTNHVVHWTVQRHLFVLFKMECSFYFILKTYYIFTY